MPSTHGVYLWNPSATAGGVTVRVFTLPLSGGVAQELTTTPIDLGTLAARSALNVKVVEDILVPLGIPLPYTTDGGDLTLEFTVLAANIKGAAQVFSTTALLRAPTHSTSFPLPRREVRPCSLPTS